MAKTLTKRRTALIAIPEAIKATFKSGLVRFSRINVFNFCINCSSALLHSILFGKGTDNRIPDNVHEADRVVSNIFRKITNKSWNQTRSCVGIYPHQTYTLRANSSDLARAKLKQGI